MIDSVREKIRALESVGVVVAGKMKGII